MSRVIGMLEYKDGKGLDQFIEASEISEIWNLPVPSPSGAVTQIIKKNGEWRLSQDPADELAEAYNVLVGQSPSES